MGPPCPKELYTSPLSLPGGVDDVAAMLLTTRLDDIPLAAEVVLAVVTRPMALISTARMTKCDVYRNNNERPCSQVVSQANFPPANTAKRANQRSIGMR